MSLPGLGLGLALALAGGCASAEPAFDAFQLFCASTRADGKMALAGADAAGWMPVPAAMLAQFGKLGFEDVDARLKTDSTGAYALVIGQQTRAVEGLEANMRVCAVAEIGEADPSALKDEVVSWAGVPPDPTLTKAGDVGFAFTEEGGGHRAIRRPDTADAKKALIASDRADLVFVRSSPTMAMAVFAVPTN